MRTAIAIAVVLVSAASVAAWYDGEEYVSAGLQDCVEVWRDYFPAPHLEQQWGKGVYIDVKVVHCPHYQGRRVVRVYERVWREVSDRAGVKEEEISGWKQVTSDWGATVIEFGGAR